MPYEKINNGTGTDATGDRKQGCASKTECKDLTAKALHYVNTELYGIYKETEPARLGTGIRNVANEQREHKKRLAGTRKTVYRNAIKHISQQRQTHLWLSKSMFRDKNNGKANRTFLFSTVNTTD